MSTQPKTIDDISRTKILLDKTERIPGRDNDGDFKITFQNLQDSLTTTVEIGTIIMYAKSTAPANYLICNGAAISRTTYASLFAVIGTVYGVGDGSTTFNLPDYRAVSPKGVGNQTINGRTKTGPASVGAKIEDTLQGFKVNIGYSINTGSGTGGGGRFAGNDSSTVSGALVTDGTNGTPRTGAQTQDCTIGTNFCIKYA